MCIRSPEDIMKEEFSEMKKGLLEVTSYHRSRKTKTKPSHLDELDSERQKAAGQGRGKLPVSMVNSKAGFPGNGGEGRRIGALKTQEVLGESHTQNTEGYCFRSGKIKRICGKKSYATFCEEKR